MLRDGEEDREGGQKGTDSESPPTNAAPVTPWDNHPSCLASHWSVCVVLYNGRHWHDSSSLPPTACHQIATLAAGKHSLAPVRRLDACILASKKFCLKGAIPLRCSWFRKLLLSVAKTWQCIGISDSSSVISLKKGNSHILKQLLNKWHSINLLLYLFIWTIAQKQTKHLADCTTTSGEHIETHKTPANKKKKIFINFTS